MAGRPLNATAASLLGFLHQGPMTGWDLVAVAQRQIGDFWSLTQSQVYRELAAMAEDGLVEAGERGLRDRRPYTITDAGRAAFAEWVAGEPGPETIRFPLLLTVVFGRYLPRKRLAEILRTHHAIHADRLAHYQKQAAEISALDPEARGVPDAYTRATLQFGIFYEGAVLSWFEQLPAEIRGGHGW
jgi:DNA-binding PadR family transcriptional regulator